MQLTLTRNPDRHGCSDEWAAKVELRPGIGKTRTEAVGSLIAANPEAFGITHQIDADCRSAHPVVEWYAPRYRLVGSAASEIPDADDRRDLLELAHNLATTTDREEQAAAVRAMVEILTGPRTMTARLMEETSTTATGA
jgi:hypothetical protein